MEVEPDDPQLFLSLRPTNSAAYQTFEHKYNRDRYDSGTFHLDKHEEQRQSSRQSTPARAAGPREPSIQLRLDQPPKNRGNGYVFGSDPNSCDVFLGRAMDGISTNMFSIRFAKVCVEENPSWDADHGLFEGISTHFAMSCAVPYIIACHFIILPSIRQNSPAGLYYKLETSVPIVILKNESS